MKSITTQELLSKGTTINGKWQHNGDKPMVVDFYADWCNGCHAIIPIMKEISSEYNDVEYFKVNVEEEPDLCEMLSIKSIPTVVVFHKDSKQQVSGSVSKMKLIDIIKNIENTGVLA